MNSQEPTCTIQHDGTEEWFLNGKRHRVNGPAIIWADGDQEWYLNGKLHRVDGPASNWWDWVTTLVDQWCRILMQQ